MVADTQEGSPCHQLEVMKWEWHTHARGLGVFHDGFILLSSCPPVWGGYMYGMLLFAITYPYRLALEVARRWRCIS